MSIEWKPAPVPFENNYSVSSTGMVKSIRFNKIMKPSKRHCGNMVVKLMTNGINKEWSIQKLVAITHLTQIPEHIVAHKDNNRSNNNVENLEWITMSENMIRLRKQTQHNPQLEKSNPPKDGVPIVGHEKYLITSAGNIYGLHRRRFLQPSNLNGYKGVRLGDGVKLTPYLVHRLVAQTFIINDDPNKCIVNHINGIKTDNRSENLEWVTAQENTLHAVATGLQTPHVRPVRCINRLGTVTEFKSIKDASEKTGVGHRNIGIACKTATQTFGDIKWEYI